MKSLLSLWALAAIAVIGCHAGGEGPDGPGVYPFDDTLRVNQIQMKGTHNSYHVAPDNFLSQIFYFDLTQPPLDVQLEYFGVRQFELDIRWDLAASRFKVFHLPVIDPETTCFWLTDCLETVRGWSDDHPGHHPLFIFIEPKEELALAGFEGRFDDLDREILSVWPRDRLITPDDLQGESPTLSEAVETRGWPTLGASRGRAVFVLLDSGEHRDAYTDGGTTLRSRVMFAVDRPGSPIAAVTSISSAAGRCGEIEAAAERGYIVRTLVDSPWEALIDDTGDRDAALRAGAHILSTDYPAPNTGEEGPDAYRVGIPGGTPSGCNPVTAPTYCTPEAIENPEGLGN